MTKTPLLARKTGMSKSKTRLTMTEVLKAAIKQSGVSRYRIAQDTGVLETSLSRFVRGETSLRLDKADVLADYLGLELERRKET